QQIDMIDRIYIIPLTTSLNLPVRLISYLVNPANPVYVLEALFIDLSATRHELFRLLLHPHTQRRLFIDLFLRGVLAHILRDLHGAEMRAAHRTEVGELGAFLGQGFVVVFARDFGIEGEIELIFPAEFKTSFG